MNYTAVEPALTATVFATATFLAEGPYIDSCLNLFTTATFFCQQGGSWGEVQLYIYKLMSVHDVLDVLTHVCCLVTRLQEGANSFS